MSGRVEPDAIENDVDDLEAGEADLRLVDDDQVLVLEQHGERDVLGRGLGGDHRGNLDAVQPGVGLGRVIADRGAVAPDQTAGHQRLQPCAGEVRHPS